MAPVHVQVAVCVRCEHCFEGSGSGQSDLQRVGAFEEEKGNVNHTLLKNRIVFDQNVAARRGYPFESIIVCRGVGL